MKALCFSRRAFRYELQGYAVAEGSKLASSPKQIPAISFSSPTTF